MDISPVLSILLYTAMPCIYRIFFYAGGKMKFLLLVILENKKIFFEFKVRGI